MPPGLLAILLLFATGLVVALAFASLFDSLVEHRMHERVALRVIGSAVFIGYLAGGALAWLRVPSGWKPSLWETLVASVDAERYGHPIEHYAQGVVIMLLCACAAGAIVGGMFATVAARLLRRPMDAG
jgi:hypothetical protein